MKLILIENKHQSKIRLIFLFLSFEKTCSYLKTRFDKKIKLSINLSRTLLTCRYSFKSNLKMMSNINLQAVKFASDCDNLKQIMKERTQLNQDAHQHVITTN